jgi:fumarate reductase subunit C
VNRRQGESENYKYKAYIPSRPATWWLRNPKYFLFMMRELSSVFIAAFLLLYLYEFFLLSKGSTVHETFQLSLRSAGFIVFYVVALAFALYHTITWFGVMGRIQVVRLGKIKVPPALVTAGAFAGWVVVSAVIGYFFFKVL